ncbi:MAG: DUF4012 domain-containing protein [Anaerolineae bacterium]
MWAFCAAVLSASVAWAEYSLFSTRLGSAQEHLRAAKCLALPKCQAPASAPEVLAQARQELSLARADFQALRDEIEPLLPLTYHLGRLPLVGKDLEGAPHLLEAGLALLAAGEGTLRGWEVVTRSLASSPEAGPRLIGALEGSRAIFIQAEEAIAQARAEREKVDAACLSPGLRSWAERLDGYLPFLEAAVRFPSLLPTLMGTSGPRRYLILIQNEDEARATGGFISAVGLLRLERGQAHVEEFMDSYAIDNPEAIRPPPPEPLARYMGAGAWFLRDVNWSPDFPTTARAAIELYRLDRGIEVDGVVAVNLAALRYVLEATGPIPVEAYGEEVGVENAISLLRRYWVSPRPGAPLTPEEESQWWFHRKDFMGALFQAMVDRLGESLSFEEVSALARALWRSLREKHLLIYFEEPESQSLLEETGFAATLRPCKGDCLMVVDSNMGFNKADALVEKEVEYSIFLGEGRVRGQAKLTYRHRGKRKVEECRQEARYGASYEEMTERCYWNYVRLYVPLRSRLVSFQPGDVEDIFMEGEHQVFAAFFVLAPGEEKQLTFTYELPEEVWQGGGNYRLVVQKQPGAPAHPFRLRVEGKGNLRLEVRGETSLEKQEGILEYQTNLDTDREISIFGQM